MSAYESEDHNWYSPSTSYPCKVTLISSRDRLCWAHLTNSWWRKCLHPYHHWLLYKVGWSYPHSWQECCKCFNCFIQGTIFDVHLTWQHWPAKYHTLISSSMQ